MAKSKKTSRSAGTVTPDLQAHLSTISAGTDGDFPVLTDITYRDVDAALQSTVDAVRDDAANVVIQGVAATQLRKNVSTAQQLLSSERFRLAYNGLRHGLLAHNIGLGLSATETILGMPAVGREAQLAKMRAAASLLAMNAEGVTFDKEVALPGRQSFVCCLSDLDYKRMQRTVNLPIGDLSTLQSFQRDKLTTYLRLVLQRMSNMARITDADEEEVIGGILNVMHKDWSRIIEDLGAIGVTVSPDAFKDDSTEAIKRLLAELRDVDESARKRFISLTVLQPLYRDVLLNRPEFTWPVVEDVVRMARAHAGWKRMKNEGVMATLIQGDISRVIAADSRVGGYATLREATFLGVKHNAHIGMATLSDALGVDAGYVHTSDATGDDLKFGDLNSTVHRYVAHRDVLGQPAVIHDHVSVSGLSERATRDELVVGIRALASLMNVDILEHISLDFISTYPEWSGIVSPDLPTTIAGSHYTLSLPLWVHERLPHEFMCAVLNGEFADTSISGLFAEQNSADLQKVFEAGAYYYGVALSVLTKTLKSFLNAARKSYEWADSSIWTELSSLGIQIEDTDGASFDISYITHMTNGPVAIGSKSHAVNATRYYVDEELLVFSPAARRLANTFQALRCYGTMETSVRRKRPFIAPSSAPIDISAVASSTVLSRSMKRDILATADQLSAADINGLVIRTRKDFSGVVYDKVVSPAGVLTSGFAFVGKISPTIEIFYDHLPRIAQLPIAFIVGTDGVDGPLEDAVGTLVYGRYSRVVDPSIAIRVINEAIDLSEFGVELALPTSDEDLRASVEKWHNGMGIVHADITN